jgi:hypothetical protein
MFMFIDLFESKIESRALVQSPLRPHPPAMALNDPVHESKPHSGSLEVLGPMQPLKDSEEFIHIPLIEPHTVVADPIYIVAGLLFIRMPSDLDSGFFAWTGIFQRV